MSNAIASARQTVAYVRILEREVRKLKKQNAALRAPKDRTMPNEPAVKDYTITPAEIIWRLSAAAYAGAETIDPTLSAQEAARWAISDLRDAIFVRLVEEQLAHPEEVRDEHYADRQRRTPTGA